VFDQFSYPALPHILSTFENFIVMLAKAVVKEGLEKIKG
jgi:hypothetical protein